MYNGIINVYKEKGFTSFDVVAKMRGIAGQKKIGHTGTLDPDAEGVLPVCLGKATRVCDLITDSDKTYRAVLRLGVETDTQDSTGQILRERPVTCGEEEVRRTIGSFVGKQSQVPPMYSALKVNGQKLCDLARAGKTVERKLREIIIYDIHIEEVKLPYVTMTVSCSKGTYIRTLCNDIGEKLGCGGCMDRLLRTKAGIFTLRDAHTLEEIQERKDVGELGTLIQPVDIVFGGYQRYKAEEQYQKMLENGNRLPKEAFDREFCAQEGEQVRIYDASDCFVGIYQFDADRGDIKPVKIFKS